MANQQSVKVNTSNHVQALRAKHQSLSQKIEVEQSKPFLQEQLVKTLKRKKLKLKEEIEGIRIAS